MLGVLVSPVVGSGRVEDEPRAHEASASSTSLNVRFVSCLSRHGFNVWLQTRLSGVVQEVRLRPAAVNGFNGPTDAACLTLRLCCHRVVSR